MTFATSTSSKIYTGRYTFLAPPSTLRTKPRFTRSSLVVNASQKQDMATGPLVAASTIVVSLASPDFAMATTLTPTVEALLKSVVAGGIIAGLIIGAVTLVAGFDPITRK